MVSNHPSFQRRNDQNLETLLYNSSANLASLIALARLHEETISRTLRTQNTNQNQIISLITGIIDSSNIINEQRNQQRQNDDEEDFEPYSINNTELFNECKYNTIPIPLNTCCPISFDSFNGEDDVILIRKCNHIFKKSSLERWLLRSHVCPYCRTTIG